MKKFLFWFIGILAVILIIFTLINITFTYSEGNRAGRFIKFPHKGYPFKTYEGEMNLGGINTVNGGVLRNMWLFSVTDGPSLVGSAILNEKISGFITRKNIHTAVAWRC